MVQPYVHSDDSSSRPDHIGCGYLRKLHDDWEEYEFPHPSFVRSQLLCHPDSSEILEGGYDYSGTLIVRSNWSLPKITPTQGGRQFFVYHSQVETWLADTVANNIFDFLKKVTGLKSLQYQEFGIRIGRVVERHTRITLNKLAASKPIYEVSIIGERQVEVRERARSL